MGHKTKIMYVELKTGDLHRGPAWVSEIRFTKSGRGVYFRDKLLRRGNGVSGNCFDEETGDEYWISGLKREGGDRHWAGGGKIFVHDDAVEEYLQLRDHDELDPQDYEVCTPRTGDIRERINALENQSA